MSSKGLHKQLAQARPSGTDPVSIYTPGSNKSAKITSIYVANTTGSSVTFSIFHDDDGTTYDESTALFFNQALAANTTREINSFSDFGLFMNNGAGNLAVESNTGSALTFTLYGVEEILGTNRGGS